jgi:hypothetical protein
MEGLGTVVIIEHLTSLRKQGLNMFPDPLGPITNDAQAHLRFRNHPGLFDLLEGLTELLLVLDLMPTEHMDDALAIQQIETKALGVTPLSPPPSALGARVPVPYTWLSSTVRPRRHIGAINTQDQHRAAEASGRDGDDALLDLVAWRDDIQHRQALRDVVGHRVHPLAPQADTGESAKQRLRFVIGDFGHQLDGCLVHIELCAPWC